MVHTFASLPVLMCGYLSTCTYCSYYIYIHIIQGIKVSMETAIKATDDKLAQRDQIRRDKVCKYVTLQR